MAWLVVAAATAFTMHAQQTGVPATEGTVVPASAIQPVPQNTPASPAAQAQGTGVGAPSAPVPAAPTFPKPDLANFTAASPSMETVNAFLHELWGYDDNRVWAVEAIQNTAAAGVARVVVYVGDKRAPTRQQQTQFFILPDGKHAIADNVIDFGAKPFASNRELLMARANGPSRGAASKQLELVEFTDLTCERCKQAETTMEQLATDFPQAHIVYQSFPMRTLDPYADQVAAEAFCVRGAKGDAGYFAFARAMYELQGGLTAQSLTQTLATAAAKASADAKAMAACAETPAAKQAVEASRQLGVELGVGAAPVLFINGRPLPLGGGVPYDVLKRIVIFGAAQDGMTLPVQPSLRSLQ